MGFVASKIHEGRCCKSRLKHQKEDLTLEELRNHLRIEEDLRKEEKEEALSNINSVEEEETSKEISQDSHKRKNTSSNSDKNNKKTKGACFHCGKPGHFKKDC